MSNTRTSFYLGLSALAASVPLAAQTASPGPSATAPAYQSAFEGYRPFEGSEVRDWRESNDTVRDVGGWRAYAREMRGAARSPGSGASAPQSKPADAQPKGSDQHEGSHR